MESKDHPSEQFTISRVFDAPRELVFAVWTEKEHLEKWWGPRGFNLKIARLEVRPGGVFHYYLHHPQGNTMWGKWVYVEVVRPEKLVYLASFSDESGETTRAPFNRDFPLEVYSIVTFTEEGADKTRVTLWGIPQNATDTERQLFGDMTQSMNAGWTGTFEQLEAYLSRL